MFQLSSLVIRKYFAQYGEIENVAQFGEQLLQSDSGYPFVEFRNSTSASAAISRRHHNINGKMVMVSVNESDLLLPPSSDSPFNILNIQDEYLMHIFEYLPLCDLCTVAEVCKKFKSNAVNAFSKLYSDFDVNMLIDESRDDSDTNSDLDLEDDEQDSENDLPMDLVENIFRNFGIHIKGLHIDQEDFDQNQTEQILELIVTFCSHDNAKLSKLVMNDITIYSHFIERLQPIFGRLNSLDITGGLYDRRHASLFSTCSQLTELMLEHVYMAGCFIQKFEKLQTISLAYICDNYVIYGVPLQSFVRMNPQLKSFTITDSCRVKSNIYDIIGSLPELEELKLHMKTKIENNKLEDDLNHLARLENLKFFSFNCLNLPIGKLLNSFAEKKIPLEDLDLSNLTLDLNIAASLSKLSQIRNLRFSDGEAVSGQLAQAVKRMIYLEKLYLCNFGQVTVDDIKEIIKNARELNDIQLYNQDGITIDSKSFNEISQLVETRGNNIKLNMHIIGDRCMFDVLEEDIERSRPWLEIQFRTFKYTKDFDVVDYYHDSESEQISN